MVTPFTQLALMKISVVLTNAMTKRLAVHDEHVSDMLQLSHVAVIVHNMAHFHWEYDVGLKIHLSSASVWPTLLTLLTIIVIVIVVIRVAPGEYVSSISSIFHCHTSSSVWPQPPGE